VKFRYVDKVGIELEGGWNRVFSYTCFKHDISVFNGSEVPTGLHEQTGHYGEVASDPLSPPLGAEWIAVHYPDFSDYTCGMHVHVSLRKVSFYQRLATRDFFNYWHKSLEQWGRETGVKDPDFWVRLDGGNRFCRKAFAAEAQVGLTRKEGNTRRTQLNYCYNLHKTIECRVFPIFAKAETAVQAFYAHVWIIEKYLKETRPQKNSTRLILKAIE
jgi:hypothetical protein